MIFARVIFKPFKTPFQRGQLFLMLFYSVNSFMYFRTVASVAPTDPKYAIKMKAIIKEQMMIHEA